jgi:ATP-dependent DNA helicase RecQ
LPADCILFFSPGDRVKIERFIEEKTEERERVHARAQLQEVMRFATTNRCRLIPLMEYFGERHGGNCGHCDNCRTPPEMIDATQDARKLLSAVARTGQRFGLIHVIDVLRGSEGERVKRWRHDELSVYGIGKEESKSHWQRVAAKLIDGGQLALTTDGFSIAHLTPGSKPVLRGEVPISVVKPSKPEPPEKASRSKAISSVPGANLPFNQELFDELRQVRRRIASDEAVPPYVVFSDASLRQMCQLFPTSLEEFSRVTGVGLHKLKRYGGAFTDAIRDFCQRNPGCAG